MKHPAQHIIITKIKPGKPCGGEKAIERVSQLVILELPIQRMCSSVILAGLQVSDEEIYHVQALLKKQFPQVPMAFMT